LINVALRNSFLFYFRCCRCIRGGYLNAEFYKKDIMDMAGKSHSWFSKYAPNIGGAVYFLSDGALILVGLATGAKLKMTAGCTCLAADLTYAAFGNKNAGFVTACVVGTTGVLMSALPPVIQQPTVAGVAGVAITVVAGGLGVFNKPITEAFKDAGNAIVRNTIGRPRSIMGLVKFISRAPLIYDAASNHRWGMFSIYSAWAFGDILTGLSKPKLGDPVRPAVVAATSSIERVPGS
jgi:hypothetical protein